MASETQVVVSACARDAGVVLCFLLVSDVDAGVSYPSFLLQVGDHDNHSHVLLPDHPPEVFPARPERPLRCDVGPAPLITLHRRGVRKAVSGPPPPADR